MNDGALIGLEGGTLLAVSQCVGFHNGSHLSLLLFEGSGEFGDYSTMPEYTCTSIGYVYERPTGELVPGAKMLHRHRSPFDENGVGDNMWSVVADEGDPLYNVHEPQWYLPDGG